MRSWRWGVTAMLVVAACSAPVPEPDGGAVEQKTDAGALMDGGSDAGAPVDAGEPLDGGVGSDAGTDDAGVIVDGGAPTDAGSPDAGVAADAGAVVDAGTPVDSGVATDAGVSTDAGVTVDAGGAVDAGVRLDAGGALDAGSTVDAGVLVDAGVSRDSGVADSGILNPFYAQPAWKLWTLDASVVTYTGTNLGATMSQTATFGVIDAGARRFPDPLVNTHPAPFVSVVTPVMTPTTSGFWDDVYATRDGAHTVLSASWADVYGNTANLSNQYVRVGFGICSPPRIQELGVNFTSESFSNSGHQLINAGYAVDYTERFFSFTNTVRATPAYLSYAETNANRGIDSFEALYSHSFNSVGRSGSELGALSKLMLAGGYLPRTTKDLLKWHGAYGMTLISLWRQALPYVAADGSPLPLANEMLQRPAYYSNGFNTSEEFVPRNKYYHQYDDSLHMHRMLQTARAMTVAPPIALVQLLDISVERAGMPLVTNATNDVRVRARNKTLVRVWGNTGERITVRVDVGSSYDLQFRPLTFEAQQVYPEQRNVTIVRESPTVFRISVVHNPMLPKGRIPVAIFANNGVGTSNPAFVNFYWPEAGQVEVPGYVAPGNPVSITEVQKNQRPVFTSSLDPTGYVNVLPGSTTTITLNCTDPEGFPTRFYRWAGEAGTLGGNTLTLTVPMNDPGNVYPLHLICSDGTGGTESKELKVVVTPADGALPLPYRSTVYGLPENAGTATSSAADTFDLLGNGPSPTNNDHGRFVFREVSGDVELTAQVLEMVVPGVPAAVSARGGLMLRESLLGDARHVLVASTSAAQPFLQTRATAGQTPVGKARLAPLTTTAAFLKLVRRGNVIAGFASTDGLAWEALSTSTIALPTTVLAGLAVYSADPTRRDAVVSARGRFRVLPPSTVGLPVATIAGTAINAALNSYRTTATVTLAPAQAADTIRYTVDGSDPTPMSPLYSAPMVVSAAGATVLRARSFSGATPSPLVLLVINITP